MALPETLREAIDAARASISRSTSFDGGYLSNNAQTCLHNGLNFVTRSAAIDTAAAEAGRAIETFRTHTGGIGLSANEKDALDVAQRDALGAIDALAAALEGARPNDEAKALGLDWW